MSETESEDFKKSKDIEKQNKSSRKKKYKKSKWNEYLKETNIPRII